jgi:DNA-binding TFAR19-related protein (PDSD5 family)
MKPDTLKGELSVSLQAAIETMLTGEGNEQTRRTAILVEILERFARERQNGVAVMLQQRTGALDENFRTALSQLEAKL